MTFVNGSNIPTENRYLIYIPINLVRDSKFSKQKLADRYKHVVHSDRSSGLTQYALCKLF